MDNPILNKVHNFGIYRKGGKRCILQLDFPGRVLLVIHKGHIKKTHSLDHLQHFDSEDGLHISLKSKDGELEFEADNTEEKYSICRLLGLAMQSNLEEDEDSIDSGQGHLPFIDPMHEHNDVIKEGILDKKGNTTFTTWNKRRVKLTPGELAYFKPGEELALNVIQLWQDHCFLRRQSYNGFTLTVRERVYSFRIANEYKATHMTEIARDDWFEAFEKALNHVPPTARLLDMSLFGTSLSSTTSSLVKTDHNNGQHNVDSELNTDPDNVYDVTPDELSLPGDKDRSDDHINPDKPVVFNHNQVAAHIMCMDEPPPLPKSKSWSRRHSSDNLLSTTTTMSTFSDRSFEDSDKRALRTSAKLSVSQCDLSLAALETTDDPPQDDGESEDPLIGVFSGTAAAFRAQLAQRGGKSSSLKTYRANKAIMTIKKNSGRKKGGWMQSQNILVQSADRTLQIRPPLVLDQKKQTHPIWDDVFPQVKPPANRSQSLETEDQLKTFQPISSSISTQCLSGKITPPVCQSETVSKKEAKPSGSPTLSHHSSRPAIAPPPPPPPLPVSKNCVSARRQSSSEFKLKQVHWVKVNASQIPWSVWKDSRDRTNELDLSELEQQFALSESKQPTSKFKTDEDKKMLVDPKRAQNLGILFSGLKLDSLGKLKEALSSITEIGSFPVDKLKTLKRYQPTAEEVELYCLHGNRRDGLHNVDLFMLELCEIPRLGSRVELVLTLWEFPGQHAALEEEVADLLNACGQLLSSDCLVTILEYLLAIGNHMNSTWGNRQDATGFLLSSLDKILTVKGKDSKSTVCTFLVKQLRRSNPGLLNWTETVSHVTKCSGYSVKAVGAEIDVLKNDLQKIKRTLKALRSQVTSEKRFYIDVQNFIVDYDLKLDQLDLKYALVSDKCKQLMMMYGEPTTKDSDAMLAGISLLVETFNQAKAVTD